MNRVLEGLRDLGLIFGEGKYCKSGREVFGFGEIGRWELGCLYIFWDEFFNSWGDRRFIFCKMRKLMRWCFDKSYIINGVGKWVRIFVVKVFGGES